MKLLMFNVKEFWLLTFNKTPEAVEEIEKEETVKDAIVVFANVEKEDEKIKERIVSVGLVFLVYYQAILMASMTVMRLV